MLAEQLGLAAVWGSEHHAVEDGHLSQQLPFLAAVAAPDLAGPAGHGVLLLPCTGPARSPSRPGWSTCWPAGG